MAEYLHEVPRRTGRLPGNTISIAYKVPNAKTSDGEDVEISRAGRMITGPTLSLL